jgi:hypothetical protein
MTHQDVLLEASGLCEPCSLTTSDCAIATRAALGLPTNQRIIATGHQPMLQHGGLLAKDISAAVLADRSDGVPVHLMLDTSTDPVFGASIPLYSDGLWSSSLGVVASESTLPLWRRNSATIEHVALDLALDDALDAVEQACTLMRWQWKQVNVSPVEVRSSTLLETPGGAWLLDAMHRDPAKCAHALSQALDVEGIDDMRRPSLGGDPELPLWASSSTSPRRMARASDLHREGCTLEPRAVLTSAIMRLFVCDRFIHGTGGGRYDRATSRWLHDWLGLKAPPPAVVTAHVRLDAGQWGAAQHAVQRAYAAVRHARHDLGAGAPSIEKIALLKAIDDTPYGTPQRRSAFVNMHAQLQQHAPKRQAAAATVLDKAITQAQLLRRRDWPLVVLPKARTKALWSLIRNSV